MKFVVLVVVVIALVWLIRGGGRGKLSSREDKPPHQPPAPPDAPQDMVQCPVCLVHLPRGDALPGPNGQLYCCSEHRVRAGG